MVQMEIKYKLLEFTADTLTRTEKAWKHDLESSPDSFPGDIPRFIEFAKNNSDYKDLTASSLAYGIFQEDSQTADSIVEVIVSKTGRHLVKMIDCFVRPSISEKAFKLDLGAIQRLVSIYAASIVGTILLGDHHKASVVKVYGRSRPLLTVLTNVATLVNESKPDLSVKASIEGRWLVIKPVKKGK